MEILEPLPATTAQVHRIRYGSGTAVTKVYTHRLATGRAELWLHRRLDPPPAPRLLAATDTADRIELVFEDLTVGHRPAARDADQSTMDRIAATVAEQHAVRLGDRSLLDDPVYAVGRGGETRMPQAHPPAVVDANAAAIGTAVAAFLSAHAAEIDDPALLERLAERWPALMRERARDTATLTVGHGDLHLLGNVLLGTDGTDGAAAVRFVDWAEHKPTVPAYDLAYLLVGAARRGRAGDEAVLRAYQARLGAAAYPLAQARWDLRFALLTNLFQAVLQDSVRWYRAGAAVGRDHDAATLLG